MIAIESEIFDESRILFNEMLPALFEQMKKNNSSDGTITMKCKVELLPKQVVERDGTQRVAMTPMITTKVVNSVPNTIKGETSFSCDDELVKMHDGHYELIPVPIDGQRDIRDYMKDIEDIERKLS